jgi:hypothetical protein
MNSFKNKLILLVLVAVGVSISSCKDYLDVNDDPNQALVSNPDLQLSSAQLNMAIGVGQRIFPTLAIWCQYHSGGPGVSLGEADQHMLSSSEGNEVFIRVYRAANNLNYITKNAAGEEFYVAISKIMKAYGFQVCADLFGDIPYTEALNGDIDDGSVLHPKYDSAKDVVYPALAAELKDAIRVLHAGGAFKHPGADDLVYGGDLENWERFANTLLLKIYLRSGNTAAAKALVEDATAIFITDNDQAAMVAFPGGSTGSNPFYTAARSTALGNFYVATTTSINYLQNTQDPRIDFFYDKNAGGQHVGMKPGDVENAPTNSSSLSTPSGAKTGTSKLFSPTTPVFLMSAWEGNLLLAEAYALGATGDAKAAYDAAVTASFDYLGAGDPAAFLAGTGAFDAANAIKSIALQKWVCMNGTQPIESWIETRRFDKAGMPLFSSAGGIFKEPTKNSLGAGKFPSVLPYPENEESLNQNFPGQQEITEKVFWDN